VTDITLAILAGGEGSRMGKPKALVRIDRIPILEFLLNRFAWTGPSMLITAPGREHPPGWKQFTKEWVDPVAGLGPLRGILTGLEHAETPIVVFATVDMPNITTVQLDWVVEQLSDAKNTLGLMTQRTTLGREQIEPFPSAFRTLAAEALKRRLEQGSRSVYSLKDQAGFAVVPAPDDWPETTWINLNDPDDLNAFLDGRGRIRPLDSRIDSDP
jgi:molybdopterin-guanine dinucleotide biosynthesis protein A